MKQQQAEPMLRELNSAIEQGDVNKAKRLQRKIGKKREPKGYQQLLLEGRLAFLQNHYDKAAHHLRQSLDTTTLTEEVAKTYYWLGRTLGRKGDVFSALSALESSLEQRPVSLNHTSAYTLCSYYSQTLQFGKLEPLANKLLAYSKYFVPVMFMLVKSAKYRQQRSVLLLRVEKLLAHTGSLNDAQNANLIQTLIEMTEFERAASAIAGVDKGGEPSRWLDVYRAYLHFSRKDYQQSAVLFGNVEFNTLPGWMSEAFYYRLQAVLAEKTGDYKQAFDGFELMNRHAQRKHSDKNKTLKQPTLADFPEAFSLPDVTVDTERQQEPVFILGFPRSGTTLLDKMFSLSDQLAVFSEFSMLILVETYMKWQLGLSYPRDLHKLTYEQIQTLRELYFGLFENTGTEYMRNGGKRVVEKNPLYIRFLPLISVLFPNSDIIICLRHPMDVCLSCYQQDFADNPDTATFCDLNRTFKAYRKNFAFLERIRKGSSLRFHELRYEELVVSPQKICDALFTDIGLEPVKNILDYQRQANENTTTTASSLQVTEPLYRSSTNKWLNYQHQLRSYIPEVQEFIMLYGYQA